MARQTKASPDVVTLAVGENPQDQGVKPDGIDIHKIEEEGTEADRGKRHSRRGGGGRSSRSEESEDSGE